MEVEKNSCLGGHRLQLEKSRTSKWYYSIHHGEGEGPHDRKSNHQL